DRDSLVSRITVSELTALLPSLEAGMIPKMTACHEAVSAGVRKAAIIDGRVPHYTLVEVYSDQLAETQVVPDTAGSATEEESNEGTSRVPPPQSSRPTTIATPTPAS